MNKEKNDMTPKEMAILAAKALDSKKGAEIKVMEVTELTSLADYFVIASGNSNTQVRGFSGEVEYRIGLDGVTPTRIEGEDSANWIILDYASVLVHIFQRESRDFYHLDRLWSEAEEVDISSLLIED